MVFQTQPQTIYLPSLNYDASNNVDIVYDTVPNMGNYDAKATLDVSYDLIKDLFQYASTSTDGIRFYTTDPSDNYLATIHPSKSRVYYNYIVTGNSDPTKGLVDGQQNVGVDFIESLSYKMFKSAYYDTFFVNANDLVSNISSQINSKYVSTSIGHISSISTTGTDPDLLGDTGSKYLTGSVGYPKNIGRILFETILRNDPGRLNVNNGLVRDTTDIQNIPLVVGDTLQFIVTLTPSATQNDVSNPNPGGFPNQNTVSTLTRKYLIEFVLS